MGESGAVPGFEELPAAEKARYRRVGQRMVRVAEGYAVPIIYAPKPGSEGAINGATGAVVQLSCGYFLVTARHVLEGYEERLQQKENINWQVGHLPPFDPLSRIAWRGVSANDTLLLRLSADEARQVGSWVVSALVGWPPRAPEIGQLILVAGYPKVLREEKIDAGIIGLDHLAAMFRVTEAGDGYFYCQIEREKLVNFSGELPLPDANMGFGGFSGGPALLVGPMTYPLVGVVSEYNESFELLRIATLDNAVVH